MSERSLESLLGTVVGLGLLWLVVSFFPQKRAGPWRGPPNPRRLLRRITQEGASALRFSGPEGAEPVELRRMGMSGR